MERGTDIRRHGNPENSPITREAELQFRRHASRDSTHGPVSSRIPQRYHPSGTLHWEALVTGSKKEGVGKRNLNAHDASLVGWHLTPALSLLFRLYCL